MSLYIIVGVPLVLIALWFIPTRHTLAILDGNINNAMSRVGAQLSSRWDALSTLLDLTNGYAVHECQTLADTKSSRRSITAESSAKEAAAQDNIMIHAIARIMTVAEQYPTLMADRSYQKSMNSANQYEVMICQSRLLYNDSVTQLNRCIRTFPTSVIAGVLGFSKRDYLEAQVSRVDNRMQ